MEDRFNTPHTDKIELEFLDMRLQLAQDPNSKHLGTTVWDSSMVFVKFLEQNCKKGEFSHSRLVGKRVIELGAGCGLSGLGMALLGCHVIATDQVEVLPLLMRNVERNMARAKHSPSQNPYLGSLGTIEVMELNWGDEDQIKALKPPFDYIIGSDIVYKEQLLDPLVNTLIGLAGPKSTIILANEYRSSTVHEKMLQLWKENFHMKIVPRSKMDPVYQHECIQLFVLRPKVDSSTSTIKQSMDHAVKGRASRGTEIITENNIKYGPNSAELDGATKMMPVSISDDAKIHDTQESEGLYNEPTSVDDISIHEQREVQDGRLNDWEMRRIGSMAARLLQSISCGDSE